MKYIYLLSLMILSVHIVQAQQELTLHNMNGIVQSVHTNPAILPHHKVIVTLGSSYHVNVKNTGFTYNQLTAQIETDETGQRVLDIGKLASALKLNGKDYVNTSASVDLFGVNFKAGKNRFSLNVTEHIDARLGYSDALLDLAVQGNVPGTTTSLEGYNLNATHYREIGLGFNRKILADDKMVVGARIKSLFGMANVHTMRSNVNLTTAEEQDMYTITADADILIRTTGVDAFDEGDLDADYLVNMANKGFGIDLGASYQYSSTLSFSASIVNLGYIKWQEGVTNYESNAEYEFTGIDNNDIFNGSFEFDATEVIDSISSEFEFEESTGSYTTSLPTQIYLSGFYQLAPKTVASASLYSDFMGGFRKGMSLGLTQTFGRWFQASTSYTMHARSFNNLGLGLAVGTGLQFYAVTDNVLALMQPGNARIVNVRTGFNFLF